MPARFHVSGGGNWNATSEWSTTTGGSAGASVPGSADTATLDASSGGGTLTLDISPTVQTLTMSAYTGTLDLNGNTLTCSINFAAGGTATRSIGAGTIALTGNNATILGAADLTNLTVSGTVNVNATYSGGTGTRTFNWGSTNPSGTEARAVNLNITAGTDTVAISGHYRNLNFTGFAGTLNNNNRTLYGGLTVSTGMTLAAGASGTTLAATSGSHTITSNGKTLDFPLTVNAPGATYTCADALTLGSTRAFTLTAGTFRLKAGTTNALQGIALNGGHLRSDTPGSAATVSATSGTKRFYNTIITDIAFTGGATFIALTSDGNVNGGGNSGIDFGSPRSSLSLSLGLSL